MRLRRTRIRLPRWALLGALLLTLLAPAEGVLAASTAPAGRFNPTAPAEAIPIGATAIVRADGDCLRLRAAPGTGFASLACLPEGTSVTALEGRASVDGYWWQRVQAGGLFGWAAEMYLRPSAPPPPAAPACPAAAGPAVRTVRPALSGTLPQAGGSALAVWSGGSLEALASAAAAGGCALRSVWATDRDGAFVGYLFGAPDFVNRAWLERFPGELGPGTAVLVVCGGPSGAATAANTVVSQITPAPSAAAPIPVRAIPPPAIDATAAVVIDGASGAVLFEKNAHQPLPPASLTKIATAIVSIERGDLDQWVGVDVDSRRMSDSTVMGLRPGDCFRLRDLLYGLLLPSGNDAALAIGRYEAGSDAGFVDALNALLGRLGLQDSHFANPHGLSAPGHRASAYDVALLARYGMTLPDFVAAVGARQWSAQGSRTIPLTNTNAFLARYPGADGVKTGFTEEAGRTLVASVTRDGRRVFVAMLNAPNRDADAQALFDWAFAAFAWL